MAVNPLAGTLYYSALSAPSVYHNPILHGEAGSADDYKNLALASTLLLPVKMGKVPTRSTVARHGLRKNLFNNSHPQGDQAIKMFQQYAQKRGGVPLTEGSINAEQIRAYVPELRERFGLVGNTKISDAALAGILNAKIQETAGNTGAVNANGEPQLLFRGDTQRYNQLKPRWSPEKLAQGQGDMDNSLGTLFLGELPGTANKHTQGLERYLVTGRDFRGNKTLESSGTGSGALKPDGSRAFWESNEVANFPEGSRILASYNTRYGGPNIIYKLPSKYSESGINDINGFVVRTPQIRDASKEISVLNDNFLAANGSQVDYHGPSNNIVNAGGEIVENVPRSELAQHYRYVLDDAASKNQGLLKSNPNSLLRDEHDDYTYFALPNFNILGAKHVLPYNFNRRRNFNNPNIYKRQGGKF